MNRIGKILCGVCVITISQVFSSCHWYDPYTIDGPGSGTVPTYPMEIQATYNTDWSVPITPRAPGNIKLRPQEPSGLRTALYTGDKCITDNLPPEGGVIYSPAGVHNFLFYNNDTEYVILYHSDSFDKAVATTRDISSESIKGEGIIPNEGSLATVNQPDMLFVSSSEDYFVDPELPFNYIATELHPVVFSYVIGFTFSEGVEYVSRARAALSGMAAGVYLHNSHTTSERVDINFACYKDGEGLQGVVRSFGVPDYPNEDTPFTLKYYLMVELFLINGKTKRFTVDVSPQMNFQPQGGVIWIDGLKVTPGEGGTSGGGFDVDVGEWGPGEDIEIIF